ncbi:MAG TPA: amidohydrolase family protein [Flavilitoribacter sp.]|nr:amidohydrolase family protein [Flavilitoribacter sp.]
MRTNLFLLALLILAGCGPQNPEFSRLLKENGNQFDLLIRNGLVLNGIDSLPDNADILIRGDEILYIGPVDTSKIEVERIIDAAGKYVTPGFIDTHAHGDPLETPEFANFLAMGVTTICLGQDGDSPETEDLSGWMQRVNDTVPGVNIALFAGHGTLRQLSGVGYAPDPSPEGLAKMKQLLQQAMDAGCFGMTTGLEYTPGIYAKPPEMAELAKVVGQNDGLIMSHVRNEDDDQIAASIQELLDQGRYCNVQVSHLKVVYGKGKERAREILDLLFGDTERPYRVSADIYPYTASYTGIGIVFPQWAKPPNDYATVARSRRAELLTFLHDKVMSRNGPEATLLGTPPYRGKTLKQVSEEMNKPFEQVLLEDIGPGGASAAYFVMDDTLQTTLLADPRIMVCSDGSPTMHHPRGYGSFARIIEQYVLQQHLFSLPEAVRKMTALPAGTLGLKDRGTLQPGRKADLLVFDPAAVKAVADFVEPHALSRGFDWVIVNGQVALDNGQFAGRRSGRVLRH